MSFKPQDDKYWKERLENDPHKDWHDKAPWIDGYWNSRDHPHRNLIMNVLETFWPFNSVLEVGCNCGPNLKRIIDRFHTVRLKGLDVNKPAIKRARELLPHADLRIASSSSIPFEQADIILTDAVLIYVGPDQIYQTISEFNRIVKKGIILVEWYDKDSTAGIIKDYHWCRNYKKLLGQFNFKVAKIKLTEESWPSKTWQKHGNVFVCRRVSETGNKKS